MIETEVNKVVYTMDQEKTFPFPYPFFQPSDLGVYVNGAKLLPQDYSIEAKEDYTDGANITLIKEVSKDSTIAILRELPITQDVNLPEYGKLPSTAVEYQLDKLTMICQQLAEELERCLQVAPGENADIVDTLLRMAQLADEARRVLEEVKRYLDQIKALLANAKLLANYIIVDTVDENGYLVCDRDSLPHSVTTDTGKVFPLEKGSVIDTGEYYLVDTKPYLAYMGVAEFTGPWLVWRTGGRTGDPGKSAYDIAVENGFVGTEKEWLDQLALTISGAAFEEHNNDPESHAEKFKGYLRLSGGTVTGTISCSNIAGQSGITITGAQTDTEGAVLKLGAGPSAGFSISTRDAEGGRGKSFRSDGDTLLWGSEEVMTRPAGAAGAPAYGVVESWRADDGSIWYRKWSDGWIEQGGILDMGSEVYSADGAPINFRTSMTDTQYSICLCPVISSGSGLMAMVETRDLSSMTIKVRHRTDYASYFRYVSWYICGK